MGGVIKIIAAPHIPLGSHISAAYSARAEVKLHATDKIALSKLSGRQRKDNLVRKINQLPEEKIDQLRDLVNKLIGE